MLNEKPRYTFHAHTFDWVLKGVNMVACSYCGLVPLRNPFTAWAIRMGCNNNDHPDYENAKKRLSGKKTQTK